VIQPCQVQARFAFSPTSLFIFLRRGAVVAAARGRSRLFLKHAEYSPGYFDLWPFDITILITARKINHPMTRNVCREMRERTVQHHLGATCAVAGMGNHFTAIVVTSGVFNWTFLPCVFYSYKCVWTSSIV
jgi:hypothetical protein